jgi:hypothetical protein
MFELLEPFLMFFFFFLLPVIGICTVPALLMGGIMLEMAEKEKEKKILDNRNRTR